MGAKHTHWAVLCLGLITLLQAFCWTLAPALITHSPPLDIVENALWGTEHVLVTYKNPTLPSLLLEATRQLTGSLTLPVYFLSQLCIAAAIWCVYLLGKPVLGPSRAAAGAMVLLCCHYFNWNTPEFNHDILQIPFWALIALSLWRAVATGSALWWSLLGVTAAASLYGKLSPVVLLASCALWLLADSRARATLATRGPWIALILFLASVAPMALLLAKDDTFATISGYATIRGQKHSLALWKWVALQVAMASPMALALWLSRPQSQPVTQDTETASTLADESELRRFLLFFTIVPVILTVLLATLHGTGAKLMWGVPMLNLVGLLLVSWLFPRIDRRHLMRLAVLTGAVIIGSSAAYLGKAYYGAGAISTVSRMMWPQEAIAKRMREIWAKETGAPLKIVAGELDNWVSGLVALSGGPVASVFTLADYRLSPWITPERFEKEGALVVWDQRADAPDKKLYRLLGQNVQRYEEFTVAARGARKTVTIGYVIIPPGTPAPPPAPAADVQASAAPRD